MRLPFATIHTVQKWKTSLEFLWCKRKITVMMLVWCTIPCHAVTHNLIIILSNKPIAFSEVVLLLPVFVSAWISFVPKEFYPFNYLTLPTHIGVGFLSFLCIKSVSISIYIIFRSLQQLQWVEKSVNACPCAVSVCLLSGIFDYLLMFVLVRWQPEYTTDEREFLSYWRW